MRNRPAPYLSRRVRRPVLLVLAMLVLPGVSKGQVVQGRVVTEEGGIPIPGAMVALVEAGGAQVDSTRTDREGRYRLRAVSPGAYLLQLQLAGYAGQTSDEITLLAGQTATRDVPYRLISIRPMQTMGEAIRADSTLQQSLPALCGDDFRPRETGLLLGVIRDRRTQRPVPGAVVTVEPQGTGGLQAAPRTTVSNEHGTYVFCNLAPGDDLQVSVRAPAYDTAHEQFSVRKGMIGWYDVHLRRHVPQR